MTPPNDGATARPWRYDDTWALITGPKGEEVAAIHSGQANDPRRVNRNVALDNAALIVQAVNSHAALLAVAEAAKRCPQWLGKMIADGAHQNCVAPGDCVGTLQRLEQALAKLREVQGGDK